MSDRQTRNSEKIGMLEARDKVNVKARQEPLRASYRTEPQKAMITDRARTTGGVKIDPFHGQVEPGSKDYGHVRSKEFTFYIGKMSVCRL